MVQVTPIPGSVVDGCGGGCRWWSRFGHRGRSLDINWSENDIRGQQDPLCVAGRLRLLQYC